MEVYEQPSNSSVQPAVVPMSQSMNWYVPYEEAGDETCALNPRNSEGPKLRAFLIPQDKGKSRNFDYCAGSVSEDPDSEYSVFCRGRPTVVPFAIGLHNVWDSGDLKLKVQVIYSRVGNKIPIRCSNHKEGDYTIWRDQLMICTDPRAQSLSPDEGYGFMIEPVPKQCDLLFLCRNSCRQGNEREWQLQFTLVDGSNLILAVRKMHLRVCEVPLRDCMKSSKSLYEWDFSSPAAYPVMRLMATDSPVERKYKSKVTVPKPVVSDVYPIYISGYESYNAVMHHVSTMEMNRKQDPLLYHLSEQMRDWTRETPILHFVQPICGPETVNFMEKMQRNDIRTLGDLRAHYTPGFFVSMNISASLASNLSSVYLNWRNLLEYYEISTAKQEEA